MSQITESSVRQRMRVGGIAAVGVAAVLFVQDLIGSVSWLLVGYSQAEYNNDMYLGHFWLTIAFGILILLAFAAGVGVSLWRFAPVTRELAPTAVVVRGLLAAAVGGVVVFVVQLGFEMIGPMSGAGPLFGHAFPWPDLGSTVQAVSMALQAAIGALVRQAPVVVLVVVLIWIWLGKHPSQHAVSADTSEV
ncbi:MAG TPA: hypothetical protein VFT01_07195 [Homoserinimonas sp.]|nr:hypothetical protein [Homoserinimonas sp.]